jgi:hypothetical protein
VVSGESFVARHFRPRGRPEMTYVILEISIVLAVANAVSRFLMVSSALGVGGNGWRAMKIYLRLQTRVRATHPALGLN